MKDLDLVIEEILNSPRLTTLKAKFFSKASLGEEQRPEKGWPEPDPLYFPKDTDTDRVAKTYQQFMWHFERHFTASVPYVLENEIRIATALLRYVSKIRCSRSSSLHLGSSEAPLAKTLAALSGGRIQSFAHSDSEEHLVGFNSTWVPEGVALMSVPSVHLTPDHFEGAFGIGFPGFDFIFEHQLFQMYTPDRLEQIEIFSRHFRDRNKGLFFLSEKLSHEDEREYQRREHLKDEGFKRRFFSDAQIEKKDSIVCCAMHPNQVTLPELRKALGFHFKHAALIWNSTNFSQVVACNCLSTLSGFLEELMAPIIDPCFVSETIPLDLLESGIRLPEWRLPSTSSALPSAGEA